MASNMIVLLLLVGLGASGIDCSIKDRLSTSPYTSHRSSNNLGIVGGTPTTIQEHPSVVGILENGEFSCAGTIVSERWVITSVFCAFLDKPVNLTIVAASSNGVKGKIFHVKTIKEHPNFTGSFDYTIVALEIKGKGFSWSDKIKPATLPRNDTKPGTIVTVVGWGDSKSDVEGEKNHPLLQGNMTWITLKECAKLYNEPISDFPDRFGCVYNKGNVTMCIGDFGDPCYTPDNVWSGFLVAADADTFCDPNGRPNIAANGYTFAPWIKSVTGAKYFDE